ncbi:MAG: response regulator [Opitutales bacterium]|nr:response regulator [Opitutales bacterium]
MGLPQSVLVVDDEAHIRVILQRILSSMGIPYVHVAENGREACEMYAQFKCELVIMDINMPVMTGTEAVARIRAEDPEAKIIMLTSLASRRAVEQSAEVGATDYLRKDLPLEQLKIRLKESIEEVFE